MKPRVLFLVAYSLLFINTRPLLAQWVSTTMPGSHLGLVLSLCVKDSELFAGTMDGVYVSRDNGGHWRKVNPVLPAREFTPYAQSITLSGSNIIVGFSEPNVYITSDDGESWKSAQIPGWLRETPMAIASK